MYDVGMYVVHIIDFPSFVFFFFCFLRLMHQVGSGEIYLNPDEEWEDWEDNADDYENAFCPFARPQVIQPENNVSQNSLICGIYGVRLFRVPHYCYPSRSSQHPSAYSSYYYWYYT